MKETFTAIGAVLTAIALFALAGVLFSYKTEVGQFVKNQAMHDCAQDYRLQFTQPEQNTTISKPIDDLYRQCLQEKGITN